VNKVNFMEARNISEKVLPIVRETRAITLPSFGIAAVDSRKSEQAHDVVTKTDLAVEEFLESRLADVVPGAGFYGEEFGHKGNKETFWLCDPVDGTAHYVRGMPFCTTMLALIDHGKVVFGAVYDFVRDELYHAELGKGAYMNESPIHVSERSKNDWYLAWESHIEKEENLKRFVRLRDSAALIKFMCCGYELAMVASGKLDGRVVFDGWGKDWDYAAGSIIVSEAGGVVANLGAKTYGYRNHDFIAANKEVFQHLTEGPDTIFPVF